MVRAKFRYYVLEISIPQRKLSTLNSICSSCNFKTELLNKVKQLHGEAGVTAVSPRFRVKYFSVLTNVICIRVSHGPHRFVASVIPLMIKMNGHDIELKTLYVAATIRKAYAFINHYYKEDLEEALCLPQKEDDSTVFEDDSTVFEERVSGK